MSSKYINLFRGLSIGALLSGSIVMLKEYYIGPKYTGSEDLDNKTVIITGATSGIGKETAIDFANRGARIILACRDMKKCAEIREDIIVGSYNKEIVCRQCDLTSQKSIREFAQVINLSEPRVNLLVNNAGVMPMKRSVTEDGIELNLGTNYMGHFLLTLLLLDKIKGSAPGRIINLTSVAYSKSKIKFEDLNSEEDFDDQKTHLQSKLANVLFTNELAQRLQGSHVTCNAVYPGLSNTNITRHMSYSKSWLTSFVLKPFLWIFLKSPRQGAQQTIYAALSPSLEGVSGAYISNQSYEERAQTADDETAAKRLWAISEKWTKLS